MRNVKSLTRLSRDSHVFVSNNQKQKLWLLSVSIRLFWLLHSLGSTMLTRLIAIMWVKPVDKITKIASNFQNYWKTAGIGKSKGILKDAKIDSKAKYRNWWRKWARTGEGTCMKEALPHRENILGLPAIVIMWIKTNAKANANANAKIKTNRTSYKLSIEEM